MSIGSILGKSFFGNKLIINNKRTYVNRFFYFLVKVLEMFFVWSKCVNPRILLYEVFDKMSIMEFLMKYNFMEFLMKCQ